jgi:hypothetical protein
MAKLNIGIKQLYLPLNNIIVSLTKISLLLMNPNNSPSTKLRSFYSIVSKNVLTYDSLAAEIFLDITLEAELKYLNRL